MAILTPNPQIPVKLEPATKEERRSYALLQAAATLCASPTHLSLSIPPGDEGSVVEDSVAMAKQLLELIETDER